MILICSFLEALSHPFLFLVSLVRIIYIALHVGGKLIIGALLSCGFASFCDGSMTSALR
jgi:hypothetical protein